MIKPKFILTVLLLICLGLTDVVLAGMVVDQVGRRLVVPENPERIIALAPSITEVVYDLGEEKRLAGVTRYSDYPSQAAELPKVGSYVRLDLEKIVSLKPELCLAIKDGNPKHIIDKIVELGISVYVIDPRNLNQTMDSISRIGRLLNADSAAARLVTDMQQRIARVRTLVSKSPVRPRVFFQIDAEPMVSAGSKTFIHELIELAGGINSSAGDDPYPRYSWEDILVLQPDIILISSMAGGLDPEELLQTWKKWDQLDAVANNRIFVVDADLFDRPTPRLIDGLEIIAEIIHPEIFKQVLTGNKNR
jgi:iron complex transport system substrate-binding protein